MATLLLDRGAAIDARTCTGKHASTLRGAATANADVLKLLLDRGADTEVKG